MTKELLADLEHNIEKFILEAGVLGNSPKYRGLPDSVKLGMLITSIYILSKSVEQAEPQMFFKTKEFVDKDTAKSQNNND